MRRRSSRTTQIILLVISVLVIASMICGALAALLMPQDAVSMAPCLGTLVGFI